MDLWIRLSLLVMGFVILGLIFIDSRKRKKNEAIMKELDDFVEPTADFLESTTNDMNKKDYSKKNKNEVPEILSLLILSRDPEGFLGPNLMAVLSTVQKRYGGMKIFQKNTFYDDDETGVLFSVASAVEPGYLELDEMHEFSTPGIILFCALADSQSSQVAFDMMLKTAKYIAARLNANLLNDSKQELTEEAVNRYYERILEFDGNVASG